MNRRLNEYLDKKGAKSLDEDVLEGLHDVNEGADDPGHRKASKEKRGTGCGAEVFTRASLEASESCRGEENEAGVGWEGSPEAFRLPKLAVVGLAFEAIVGGRDDGLQRVGAGAIEVGILSEQFGDHGDRLARSPWRGHEVDGIEP